MLLVLVLAGLFPAADDTVADVVPEAGGVVPPDPVRVAVLRLVPLPAPVLLQFGRNLPLAGVMQEPLRMSDRDRVLALLAEGNEVVGRGHGAAGRILDDGPMSKRLDHCPVSDL